MKTKRFTTVNLFIISLLIQIMSVQVHAQGGNDPVARYVQEAEAALSQGNKAQAADLYNKAANVCWQSENNELAIQYYTKSIAINRELGNRNAVASVSENIANIYSDMGQTAKAVEYYTESLKINQQLRRNERVINVYISIATLYQDDGRYAESNTQMLKALDVAKELNNPKMLRSCYAMLSENYRKLGNSEKFNEYQALWATFDKLIKDQEIKEIENKSQSEVNQIKGEKNATEAILRSTEDSLQKVNELSSRKQLQIELLKQQQEIDELRLKEKEAVLQANQRTMLYLIGGLVLVLGFTVVVLKQMRKIGQQKHAIETQNVDLRKLSLVASKTQNLVVIFDAEGDMEWVNESFERTLGLTKEEFIARYGKNIRQSSLNAKIESVMASAIENRQPRSYYNSTTTRQGRELYFHTNLTPIFDEAGNLEKFVVVDSDISQLIEAENQIKKQNKNIKDSITYASRIQSALLESEFSLTNHFADYMIYFKPRDIVSGDFYWLHYQGDRVLIAAADCTGHGVPGAFMSLLGIAFLNEMMAPLGQQEQDFSPAHILDHLKDKIVSSLHQGGKFGDSRDGMDMALCCIDFDKMELQFAGAHNPLVMFRNGELIEVEADRMPVGYYESRGRTFTNHTVSIQHGDVLYLFSDGYADQLGGDNRRKFLRKRFYSFLQDLHSHPFEYQKQVLDENFYDWKGVLPQTDDILILGLKL